MFVIDQMDSKNLCYPSYSLDSLLQNNYFLKSWKSNILYLPQ